MLTGLPLLLVILLAVAFVVVASSKLKLHPFLALLLASLGTGLAAGLPLQDLIAAINGGFGGLMGYIGLVVVIGSMIGTVLEKSGAAMRIATLILRLVGNKRPALAMSIIGATVSIPVFCDSGFIILSGLNSALSRKTGAKKASLALALAAGLYTTHTLVPPTPGPIAAAGNLGASAHLGIIMLVGLLVSVPTIALAYFVAVKKGAGIAAQELDIVQAEPSALPPAIRSLAPVLVPILLIATATGVNFAKMEGWAADWLLFLGHPLMALLVGLLLSFSLFKKWDGEHLGDWLGEGVKLAGPILVVTGAGGAFGGVLKATPLADLVASWVAGGSFSGGAFLLVAFLIAALLKTSQGSSTNALVITSSMLAPLVGTMGFATPFELALVVMAIGGGAMTLSHANDSYFWVVAQFSGISLKDAYRGFSVLTGLQGLVVLATTLLLYFVFV
jgi:GntP family gluconate:H+ symporter